MKKYIVMLFIICCIFVFASCNKKPATDDNKTLETAESNVEITGNAGALSVDETVARTLLEVYSKENLGLSAELYEYELELSPTRFANTDACLVEAFSEGAETPEGTFIILGQQCFVYDVKTQKYLLLTLDGAVELETAPKNDKGDKYTTTQPSFEYDKDNNEKLQSRFSAYTQKQLGLEKEISEYILVTTGTTTTAENGETVYVIRLYEKTGEATNITIAFNGNGNYVFDYDINRYVKL